MTLKRDYLFPDYLKMKISTAMICCRLRTEGSNGEKNEKNHCPLDVGSPRHEEGDGDYSKSRGQRKAGNESPGDH